MAKRDIVDTTPDFKPGDPEPDGYNARITWANVQLRAGYRQVRRECGKYHFPFEVCEHQEAS